MATLLLAAGCGGGDASTPGKAGSPTDSGTPTASDSAGPAGTVFKTSEIENLYRKVRAVVEAERTKKSGLAFYATDKPRATALVAKVAGILPKALPTRPEGATVLIEYAVQPYDEPALLRCSGGPGELRLVLVTDAKGKTFTTITADSQVASFLVYDYDQRGQQTFDKNGFATGSGACAKTGSVTMLVVRRVSL